MVAGSSSGKNPIIRAILRELDHCEDLDPIRIRETAVNEPLINWHSIDGDLALDAVRNTDGWAGFASDKAATRTKVPAIRRSQSLTFMGSASFSLNSASGEEMHKR